MEMKRKLTVLTQRYARALRRHLGCGPAASLRPALRVGQMAVELGLETLDLARIHGQAVDQLRLSEGGVETLKRADLFFGEAIAPIVETHHAARQNRTDLRRLNEELGRRTMELAATNRQLRLGINRRKTIEAALRKSGDSHAKLLKDSLQLQDGLRRLTRQVVAAHEAERRQLSQELRNEVAQGLLGINVRLLSLKQEAKSSTKILQSEIASTQRLVTKSEKSARRVARGIGGA